MTFTLKKSWSDSLVLGLSVFLVFCLIFEPYIELPELVGWLGNWHPLILHFPIVLLVVAVYVNLVHKKNSPLLLTIATLTVLITAITGFFLSLGSSEKGDILFWHQWLGAGLALLTALWYWLDSQKLGQHKVTKGLQLSIVLTTVLAGHFGGMVTHGEDFLALPSSNSFEEIPENPLIYKHIVASIIDDKCASCHNPNKQKGEYSMSSLKNLIKGGKTGKAIDKEHPKESELLKRLHLPNADEEHMPPQEKKQLTSIEIQLIEEWVRLGASDTLQLNQLKNDQPLLALVNNLMRPDAKEKWTKLPKVDKTILSGLNSDYLTIKKLASTSEALSINLFTSPKYEATLITNLAPIAQNIITLDLSGIPIGAKEMEFIAKCINLEILEIDKTPVTDRDIIPIKSLSKLRSLKVYNTKVSDESIDLFKGLSSLEKLYVKGSAISAEGISSLQKERPSLVVIGDIDAEIKTYFIEKDTVEITTKKEAISPK
jgi:uncharacterized membrane protein